MLLGMYVVPLEWLLAGHWVLVCRLCSLCDVTAVGKV